MNHEDKKAYLTKIAELEDVLYSLKKNFVIDCGWEVDAYEYCSFNGENYLNVDEVIQFETYDTFVGERL